MNKKEREICQFEMNFKKSSCWRSNLLNDENKNSTKSVWILEARFTKILGIPRGGEKNPLGCGDALVASEFSSAS